MLLNIITTITALTYLTLQSNKTSFQFKITQFSFVRIKKKLCLKQKQISNSIRSLEYFFLGRFLQVTKNPQNISLCSFNQFVSVFQILCFSPFNKTQKFSVADAIIQIWKLIRSDHPISPQFTSK